MANPDVAVVLGVHCAGCAQFIAAMPEAVLAEKDRFDGTTGAALKCHRCAYEKTYTWRDLVEHELPRSLPRR